MSRAPGVWITGPSRTGTSLTAGLFAAHGVFFGDCGQGDKFNPKGYFEHPLLVKRVTNGVSDCWPRVWWEQLEAEGWDASIPWGVKRGPSALPWTSALRPSVIVICKRPLSQIRASRERWGRGGKLTRRALRSANSGLDMVRKVAACPVVTVNTNQFVLGDYSRILPAFEALGVDFDPKVAAEWVDPSMWNGGKPTP